ncbi:uncharacterized protein LOC119688983 [Teleopsis dalmanni]|uniref:uncharacterized protein LOC119688983 n=1 Tax=Teleopsis dalmanni TaxID=139649 RepID=UPI0018CD6DEA|nr:uncharacterized protein LOC119688983 [Teleopsis dalmanni]
MDPRRYGGGFNDEDMEQFASHHVVDYFNLPVVGGTTALRMCPTLQLQAQARFEEQVCACHVWLRQQMDIPDAAFIPFEPDKDRPTSFVPFMLSYKYKMQRSRRVDFQKRLDVLVDYSFWENFRELNKMIKYKTYTNHFITSSATFGICYLFGKALSKFF